MLFQRGATSECKKMRCEKSRKRPTRTDKVSIRLYFIRCCCHWYSLKANYANEQIVSGKKSFRCYIQLCADGDGVSFVYIKIGFFSAGNLTSTFGKCVSLSACVVSGKRARCKENSQILFHCLLALFGCKTFPHSINNNVYNADIND